MIGWYLLGTVNVRAAPATATPVVDKRRTGRPRRASTDEKILRATLDLLQRGGPNEITIDAIATRSGAAKTTIYRRWPNLENLLVDALRVSLRARLDQDAEVREYDETHGSPIRGAARQILNLMREPLFKASFPMMARILLGDRVLGDRFRAEVFAPLREVRREEIRKMISAGRFRQEMDPDLVLDLVNGAILYRALMAAPLDEAVVDEIADIITRSFELDA